MEKIFTKRKPGRPRSNRKIKIMPITLYEEQFIRILKYKDITKSFATTQAIRELIEEGLKSKNI